MKSLIHNINAMRIRNSNKAIFICGFFCHPQNGKDENIILLLLRNGELSVRGFQDLESIIKARHTKKSFDEIFEIFRNAQATKDIFKAFDFEKACLLRKREGITLLGVFNSHMQLASFYYNIKRILDDKSIKKVA